MTDDRLAAAREALARAEAQAAQAGGFLAAERSRIEGSAQAQKAARKAARERRREEREAWKAANPLPPRQHREPDGPATPWSDPAGDAPSFVDDASGEAAPGPGVPWAGGSGDGPPEWATHADADATAPGLGAPSTRSRSGRRDIFAPERAAAAGRRAADARRRCGKAAPADAPAGPTATGEQPTERTTSSRPPWKRPSPFEAPEDAPDAVPDAHEVARQIVLRQLAMAPRSRSQLAGKLADRGCPPEVADVVLDRFEEVGLVDDEEYAAMLVRSQVASKGLSRRGLAHELRKKGIDADIADDALAQVDPDDERRTARALVDKRLRTMGGLAVEVQTRRLAGMLARKGYPSGLAYAVIRDAIADAPEHQRD